MLKTLKPSEMVILFQKGFLLEYFKYVMEYPDTLLMKILGVYQITFAKDTTAIFLLTENMLGPDT